jgi:hypothetical protein
MIDQLAKLQDIKDEISALKKKKTELLVKVRQAELWIEEWKPEYYSVLNNYNESKRIIKDITSFKHYPLIIRFIAAVRMFLRAPIKFFTVGLTYKKGLVENYWIFKKIKKEWEDDFNFTEKMIDKDYALIEQSEKWIKEVETLIEKGDIQYD